MQTIIYKHAGIGITIAPFECAQALFFAFDIFPFKRCAIVPLLPSLTILQIFLPVAHVSFIFTILVDTETVSEAFTPHTIVVGAISTNQTAIPLRLIRLKDAFKLTAISELEYSVPMALLERRNPTTLVNTTIIILYLNTLLNISGKIYAGVQGCEKFALGNLIEAFKLVWTELFLDSVDLEVVLLDFINTVLVAIRFQLIGYLAYRG